jgi:hypothetical protein
MSPQQEMIQNKGSLDRLDAMSNNYDDTYHQQQYQYHQRQDILTAPATSRSHKDGGESSITDLVVRAASACNKMIIEKCGLCTVYCDQQIQYEALSKDFHNTAQHAILDLYYEEVQSAKNFLFDEDNVVDSITQRI